MERGTTRTHRRRYVAFKVDSPRPLQRREVVALLKSMLGEKDLNTTLLNYDTETKKGILRCDHRNVSMVRNLLNTSTHITTLKTSGTLKALRRKLSEPSSLEGGPCVKPNDVHQKQSTTGRIQPPTSHTPEASKKRFLEAGVSINS